MPTGSGLHHEEIEIQDLVSSTLAALGHQAAGHSIEFDIPAGSVAS